MSNIKYLKDESGNRISPVTNIKGIFDDTGKSLLDIFYPVGSYYETSNEQFNPNVTWGGTWVQDSVGLCTIAADVDGDSQLEKFNNRVAIGVSAIRGELKHTLTIDEMASHTHTLPMSNNSSAQQYTSGDPRWPIYWTGSGSWGNVNKAGGDEPHNNVQPSIGVIRWHRTA